MNDFKYIQDYYGVPAQLARRVEVSGNPSRQGVIIGTNGHYIEVHLDGDKKPKGYYHPTDGITYLEMGEMPKLTKSQERYRRYRSLDCFDNFWQFLMWEKDERRAHQCGFNSVSDYRRWHATL